MVNAPTDFTPKLRQAVILVYIAAKRWGSPKPNVPIAHHHCEYHKTQSCVRHTTEGGIQGPYQ